MTGLVLLLLHHDDTDHDMTVFSHSTNVHLVTASYSGDQMNMESFSWAWRTLVGVDRLQIGLQILYCINQQFHN